MTNRSFPEGFLFGMGSSSYQVEGAWDEDGKGESIIDNYAMRNPNWTEDRMNGDVACDSYHLYREDVQLLKELKVDFYRFSISWPRILPTGDPTKINQPGIDYYNNLINELKENNIEPVVTIYHWDLPQALQELGGWANRIIIYYFEEFCRICFKNFGDRVRWWVTLNEPQLLSTFGYGNGHPYTPIHPPAIRPSGVAEYLAVHHLLLAHAKVYHMYKESFRKEQDGKLGIAANIFHCRPGSDSKEDKEAAERYYEFLGGWILHPLLDPSGDYPPIMRERVDRNSKLEGRNNFSRLPIFTDEEKQLLKGTLDYVGLNYYTTLRVDNGLEGTDPSYSRDSGAIVNTYVGENTEVPGVPWLAHSPEGMRCVLNWIKNNYGNPPVFVTENGCDDPNGLNDEIRITYHKEHLSELLNAVDDGCKVFGYTVWSLMDSFEWTSGYMAHFGVYHVDFNDPKRKRTPKASAKFFQELHKTRKLIL